MLKEKTTSDYELQLTSGQLKFLASDGQGINRISCLASLIEMAAREPTPYQKKGYSSVLEIGQVAMSEVELAALWKCNRKTASKMIDKFNETGLITSEQGNRTSVHTIHCVSRWLVDYKPIDNPSAKVPEPFVTNHIKIDESRVDKPPDTSTE